MTTLERDVSTARSGSDARSPWRAYAMDGALLGLFMVSACLAVTLVQHPALPVRGAVRSEVGRRAIVGVAMGLTGVALIYSPWGTRSGALMNPAVAVAHWRVGRLTGREVTLYAVGQLVGGAAGVAIASAVLGPWLRHPDVNYVATHPGMYGVAAAWVAEFAIACLMMATVVGANRVGRLRPYTGWVAGALVALYITFEAPLSGMSMNPARTFASAVVGGTWTAWWVYVTAPLLGMLCGIEGWRLVRRGETCGKFSHRTPGFVRCNCV